MLTNHPELFSEKTRLYTLGKYLYAVNPYSSDALFRSTDGITWTSVGAGEVGKIQALAQMADSTLVIGTNHGMFRLEMLQANTPDSPQEIADFRPWITAFPNPCRSGSLQIRFQYLQPSIDRVNGAVMVDLFGQTVYDFQLDIARNSQSSDFTASVSLTAVASGCYYVVLQAGRESMVRPVIVVR